MKRKEAKKSKWHPEYSADSFFEALLSHSNEEGFSLYDGWNQFEFLHGFDVEKVPIFLCGGHEPNNGEKIGYKVVDDLLDAILKLQDKGKDVRLLKFLYSVAAAHFCYGIEEEDAVITRFTDALRNYADKKAYSLEDILEFIVKCMLKFSFSQRALFNSYLHSISGKGNQKPENDLKAIKNEILFRKLWNLYENREDRMDLKSMVDDFYHDTKLDKRKKKDPSERVERIDDLTIKQIENRGLQKKLTFMKEYEKWRKKPCTVIYNLHNLLAGKSPQEQMELSELFYKQYIGGLKKKPWDDAHEMLDEYRDLDQVIDFLADMSRTYSFPNDPNIDFKELTEHFEQNFVKRKLRK